MKFNFKKFGEAVRFKRTAGLKTHDKPYSLKELAEEIGVEATAIWRLEHGRDITTNYLLVLGEWSGLDLYDFVEK